MAEMCSLCGGAGPRSLIHARETMFGTGEEFDYSECGSCGALQLMDPPADLSPYYPSSYYSYNAHWSNVSTARRHLPRHSH